MSPKPTAMVWYGFAEPDEFAWAELVQSFEDERYDEQQQIVAETGVTLGAHGHHDRPRGHLRVVASTQEHGKWTAGHFAPERCVVDPSWDLALTRAAERYGLDIATLDPNAVGWHMTISYE